MVVSFLHKSQKVIKDLSEGIQAKGFEQRDFKLNKLGKKFIPIKKETFFECTINIDE